MLDASAIELNEAVKGRDLLQQKPIIVEPLLDGGGARSSRKADLPFDICNVLPDVSGSRVCLF